jgi:large subunit ribosomal protein L10
MRLEKKYLADEVENHLNKSDYVFLANYTGITVKEIAELRSSLAPHKAEFHVIKNSAFEVAARAKNLPKINDKLAGPTAIVVGGKNPSEIAKVLVNFHKTKDKVSLKLGVLGSSVLNSKDVHELSKLPSLEILRAQLLGLLNTPAQQTVRVLNAVPQGMINVLAAKQRA